MQMLKKPIHQQGMSLVELMIASTVSLFLIAGMLQLFASNRQAFQTISGMSRLQENARMANTFLSREIRMANHAGCRNFNDASMNPPVSIVDLTAAGTDTYLWDLSNAGAPAFIGFDHNGTAWQPSLPTGLSADLGANLDTGSDILVIRRMSTAVASLKDPVNVNDTQFKLHDFDGVPTTANNMEIKNGNIYVLNDCSSNIFVFQMKSHSSNVGNNESTISLGYGSMTPGNTTNKMPIALPAGTEMGKLVTSIFYVQTVNGVRTLSRAYLDNVGSLTVQVGKEELVRGIDSMQILYGEDTDGDSFADEYHPAAGVTDWKAIASVHLTFTASSIDSVGSGVTWNNNTTPDAGNLWGALSGITNLASGTLMRRFTNIIDLRNPPKN